VYAEVGIDISDVFLFIWVASLRYPNTSFLGHWATFSLTGL